MWIMSSIVGTLLLDQVTFQSSYSRLTESDLSIREFCDLSIPIFMFDVKNDYVVMTLGEVRETSTLQTIYNQGTLLRTNVF